MCGRIKLYQSYGSGLSCLNGTGREGDQRKLQAEKSYRAQIKMKCLQSNTNRSFSISNWPISHKDCARNSACPACKSNGKGRGF